MKSRLPAFLSKDKICIICEGDEEYDYLNRLKELRVWNEQYEVFLDNAAEEVLIYGNPCTMQIILEHWTDVRLKSPAKKVNASVIKEFTGVDNYKGRADQRKEIMKHITAENYQDMYTRICKMQNDDTVIGNSNFDKLVKYLSSDDDWWISEINKKLEG